MREGCAVPRTERIVVLCEWGATCLQRVTQDAAGRYK